MARSSPIVSSFNAGEVSPLMEGRVDVAKYAASCKKLENFIPVIQGPAIRRAGFRFVSEVKDSTRRVWLVKFEFNTAQAYVLEFGDRYIRFFANHGQVVTAPGVPYEIASPYLLADLTNADGTFALRFVESADVVYIAHTKYQPRKLVRNGPTSWALSAVQPTGGPFKTENITATTVYASAATGAVTLTASAAIFTAELVGSLVRLQPQDFSAIPPWEPYTEIVNGTGGNPLGLRRRSAGKNYLCTTSYAITGTGDTAAVRTGTDKPVHTSGTSKDGTGNKVNAVAELVGVAWQFTDPGYGIVKITGYTSPTQVTGTVVAASSTGIAQLPAYVVGSGNATTRWALSDWSDVEGWPSHVAFFRERLIFGRSQRIWMSVAGDYENFSKLDDSGQVAADMAIVIDLQSTQVNNMLWLETFSPSIEALMVGTAGSEFVVKSQTENAVFGPDNITAAMISTFGSRNMQPRRVGNVILYAQRAGLKLRDLNYDFYSSNDGSNDQSLLAEHMLRPGIIQIEYQQEPHSTLWAIRSDGGLIAMTYSREQYPDPPHGGWHRHPVGGGGIVEAICAIPAPDQSRDELWAVVRLTIGGVTRRYVGWMEWEHRTGDDQQDAFYVDWGLTLDNSAETITGSSACTLTPGAGATVKGETAVQFNAADPIFQAGDVGREIQARLQSTADDGKILYTTAKAKITDFSSSTMVFATITAAFPTLAAVAAADWRLTVTTISGLSHLEGQTVDVCADGATHPQRVVSGGSIVLQAPACKVHVGLPMKGRLQTMRMNAGAQDGTSQGKLTRINKAVIRVLDTLGLRFGPSFDALDTMDFRSPDNPMDNAPPLFTGDRVIDWEADYDTEPWLCFETADPLPCTIVAIMPQVVTQDRG